MLTRLKVSGFKNLVDVDVRFGPFTCIAGANGVGKSNLFDAIQFLSALADRPLLEAAQSVRAGEGRPGDVDSLFHRVGDQTAEEMSFEAEMIVPREGVGTLGQKIEASATFLRYKVTIGRREDRRGQPLEVLFEELSSIPSGSATADLLFPASEDWRRSAIADWDRLSRFLFAKAGNNGHPGFVKFYDEQKNVALDLEVAHRDRTVLSGLEGTPASPTALLAKREIQGWKLLHLEPVALREPDDMDAPSILGEDGSHLAATLYRIATQQPEADDALTPEQVYGQVAGHLSELINEAREIWVDADDRRWLLTLMTRGRNSGALSARALSEGTLRFLALAVLSLDPLAPRVLCLEEPENGIHPRRVPAMLRLLQEIPTDLNAPVGSDNLLRQVIINTHSPAVVAQVPDESLLFAELVDILQEGRGFRGVTFRCLPDTWRAPLGRGPSAQGNLLPYLNPFGIDDQGEHQRRVVDREDVRKLLVF